MSSAEMTIKIITFCNVTIHPYRPQPDATFGPVLTEALRYLDQREVMTRKLRAEGGLNGANYAQNLG